MKIQKNIKDVKFHNCNVYGTEMPVSENIVKYHLPLVGMSERSVKTQIVVV